MRTSLWVFTLSDCFHFTSQLLTGLNDKKCRQTDRQTDRQTHTQTDRLYLCTIKVKAVQSVGHMKDFKNTINA